mgnify:CR=1 FL=1
MNLPYYIFLIICFFIFNKLKLFNYINKNVKVKDKSLVFGVQFAVFYILTTVLKNLISRYTPLIEGHGPSVNHIHCPRSRSRGESLDRLRRDHGQSGQRCDNINDDTLIVVMSDTRFNGDAWGAREGQKGISGGARRRQQAMAEWWLRLRQGLRGCGVQSAFMPRRPPR